MSSTSSADTAMLRRPNPARSGRPGWAPTATPAARARRTVARITPGSPAWYPQATFAEVIAFISSVSLPSVQRPNDSPRSELRSMVVNWPTPSRLRPGAQPIINTRCLDTGRRPNGTSSGESVPNGTEEKELLQDERIRGNRRQGVGRPVEELERFDVAIQRHSG